MTKLPRALTALCLLGLLCSSAAADDDPKKPRTVKIGDRYSMDVPAFMAATKDLAGDAASLQFSNPAEELYIIVVEDSKAAAEKEGIQITSELYLEGTIKQLKASMKELTATKPAKGKTTQGLPTLQSHIQTTTNTGHQVYYEIAIVESKTHFYKVVAWTLLAKKDTYGPLLSAMIQSLKELGGEAAGGKTVTAKGFRFSVSMVGEAGAGTKIKFRVLSLPCKNTKKRTAYGQVVLLKGGKEVGSGSISMEVPVGGGSEAFALAPKVDYDDFKVTLNVVGDPIE